MEKNDSSYVPTEEENKNVKLKIKKSSSDTTNNGESSVKRTFFASFRSRTKKKRTKNNNIAVLERSMSDNSTERDAGICNEATNEIDDFSENLQGLMVTEPHAEEYFMNHARRGKVIIFNHENFDKEDSRDGTKIDVERISNVFEQLRFEVEVHHDLDYIQLINKIIELSKDDYTNCDCIAIFVLTHGKKNGLLSAKDMTYPADKLWENFTSDKCVTLAGKPKLFFISACRGKKKDSGIRLFRGRIQTDSSNKTMYKIPNQADFLIANSTAEGYYSYRDVINGTWFIQCLCEVLLEHHETKDLLKMLTITTRKVAIDYRTQHEQVENHDLTQVPSVTSMLLREVYFKKQDSEK